MDREERTVTFSVLDDHSLQMQAVGAGMGMCAVTFFWSLSWWPITVFLMAMPQWAMALGGFISLASSMGVIGACAEMNRRVADLAEMHGKEHVVGNVLGYWQLAAFGALVVGVVVSGLAQSRFESAYDKEIYDLEQQALDSYKEGLSTGRREGREEALKLVAQEVPEFARDAAREAGRKIKTRWLMRDE